MATGQLRHEMRWQGTRHDVNIGALEVVDHMWQDLNEVVGCEHVLVMFRANMFGDRACGRKIGTSFSADGKGL